MPLSKFERKALQIFAKTCKPKDSCGTVLIAKGFDHEKCEFDMCCLKCFLRGEIHRLKEYNNTVTCGKEFHDYFDDNTILTEEYPLAGLQDYDVERAITMLKEIRGGMKPEQVMREYFGITEELVEAASKFLQIMKEETRID